MTPNPEQITLEPDRLKLLWSDGLASAIDASDLRRHCRCSECQSRRLRGQPVDAPPGLALRDLSPVGHYAVQIHFGDGHERGIFPWELLRELALEPRP